jgi:hypothetical protein
MSTTLLAFSNHTMDKDAVEITEITTQSMQHL